jgi:hypothetical protein
MEPALLTDPSLLGVLEELKEREPIFHRPELGTTRADFDGIMAGDFWEIGASGQRTPGSMCWTNWNGGIGIPVRMCGRRAVSTVERLVPKSIF